MPDLADLPDGTRVFVDTNIFHFHFQGKSQTCTTFLTRIARREIEAYVNTHVLAELLHKLMMTEAFAKKCTKSSNPQELKKYLKANHNKEPILTEYQLQFEAVMSFGLRVIRIDEKLLVETKKERASYYLMTGDSLHIGCMQRRRSPLRHIATHDADFVNIPNLTVWQPTDIPNWSKGNK